MKENRDGNIVVYQSPLNQAVLAILLLLLAALAIWGSIKFDWSIQMIELGQIGGKNLALPLPVFILPMIVILGLYLRATYNYKLVFSPNYLIYISGLNNWKEKTVRVDYPDIKEIEIDQTLYQKVFNLGDIVILIISTQIDSSLRMPGVKNPRKVKDHIRERSDQAKLR